jgi:hypothetical protein
LGVDDPAVPESMCSKSVAQVGDVSVRDYGLPANATLVQVHVDGSVFYEILTLGIQMRLSTLRVTMRGARMSWARARRQSLCETWATTTSPTLWA